MKNAGDEKCDTNSALTQKALVSSPALKAIEQVGAKDLREEDKL